jgi:hypothetical protein
MICAQTCSTVPVYWLLLAMSCVATLQQQAAHQHTSTVADCAVTSCSAASTALAGCRFRNAVKPGWKERDLPGSGLLYDLGKAQLPGLSSTWHCHYEHQHRGLCQRRLSKCCLAIPSVHLS